MINSFCHRRDCLRRIYHLPKIGKNHQSFAYYRSFLNHLNSCCNQNFLSYLLSFGTPNSLSQSYDFLNYGIQNFCCLSFGIRRYVRLNFGILKTDSYFGNLMFCFRNDYRSSFVMNHYKNVLFWPSFCYPGMYCSW